MQVRAVGWIRQIDRRFLASPKKLQQTRRASLAERSSTVENDKDPMQNGKRRRPHHAADLRLRLLVESEEPLGASNQIQPRSPSRGLPKQGKFTRHDLVKRHLGERLNEAAPAHS
jgi:hypothetical protein